MKIILHYFTENNSYELFPLQYIYYDVVLANDYPYDITIIFNESHFVLSFLLSLHSMNYMKIIKIIPIIIYVL